LISLAIVDGCLASLSAIYLNENPALISLSMINLSGFVRCVFFE
jgi:hypothetical protein